MSHTPGEWQAEKATSLGYRVIAVSPDGVHVVVESIDKEGRYGAIGESDDALLMAAAPEMLAILEELRESSTCFGTYDLLEETTWASPYLADRIEAAIRKARCEE